MKNAGLNARDYYPNFSTQATSDAIIPEAGDQQAISANTDTVVPNANAKSIWIWVGVIAALAVLMHLKV